MKKNILFLFFAIAVSSVQAQDITGRWQGVLSIQGTEIPLIFNISEAENGIKATLDSPAQGAFGIEASSTSFEDEILKIELATAGISYEARLGEGQRFEGYFKQGGASLPLNLSRGELEIKETSRPQDPKEPFAYHTEDVVFRNHKDNIDLAGTLSLPSTKGNFPTVVLISGSGGQNRNSELLGHRPFLVLADHLTRNGIAVLRFDDRGVGESGGDFSTATTSDFSTDVEAALDYLKSRREVDMDNLGLIGHSEGGMVASIVARQNPDVDFIVLLAGPGLRGDKFMLLQRRAIQRKMGASGEQVATDQELFEGIYNVILRSTNTGPALRIELKEYLSNLPNTPLDESTTKQIVEELSRPWWVGFLKYDPSEVLAEIEVPVLALNGANDLQVVPQENLEAIRTALEKGGNRNVEIKTFENLNHLFQESQTGLPNEYREIEQTFSPIALNYLTNWILNLVR